MDILALMRWVKDECERRGVADQSVIVRAMHEAAAKRQRGLSENDAKREAVDALKLAGFYLPGEQTFEEVVAQQEKLSPTKVTIWRSEDGGPRGS